MEHGFAPVDGQAPCGHLASEDSPTSELEYSSAPAWSELWPRGVPRAVVQLWTGRPGAGKSRLALRLGTDVGACAYLSLEMSEPVLIDTARSCGGDLTRLWPYYDSRTLMRDLPLICPTVVIVDSMQELSSKRVLSQLIAWCRTTPGILILISQVNSEGQPRGGNAVPHGVDAVFDVQSVGPGKARIKARKNRLSLGSGNTVYSLGTEQP
jgi:predicted ATP-dependent serine protease